MRQIRIGRLLAAVTLAGATGALAVPLAAQAQGLGGHDGRAETHALFVETDQSANAVIAYTRHSDGTLGAAHSYLTGGAGASAAGAVADPLASQGGLTLVGGGADLVAVNPGSDTISLFAVDGARLRLVEQLASGGSFPVSVASSGSLVAVANAGGAGSVAEFVLRHDHLTPLSGQVRSLGLANATPPDFVKGVGQVGYSPDGRFLVVTTKHSSDAYEVFSVGAQGQLSTSAAVTPSATPVPFAFSFVGANRLAAVEAATSTLTTYQINADGTLSALGLVSDGQGALCWIASAQGYLFGSNAASATVSSFTVALDGTPSLSAAVAATAHAGTTDSAASPDGRFLYVESGAAGALDAFAVGAGGSLTPVETLWNLPVPFEGIAAS